MWKAKHVHILFFRFDPANLHIALQVHSQKQPALHCARHKKQKGPLAIEHLPFDFNMIPAKYTAKQFCCNLSLASFYYQIKAWIFITAQMVSNMNKNFLIALPVEKLFGQQ